MILRAFFPQSRYIGERKFLVDFRRDTAECFSVAVWPDIKHDEILLPKCQSSGHNFQIPNKPEISLVCQSINSRFHFQSHSTTWIQISCSLESDFSRFNILKSYFQFSLRVGYTCDSFLIEEEVSGTWLDESNAIPNIDLRYYDISPVIYNTLNPCKNPMEAENYKNLSRMYAIWGVALVQWSNHWNLIDKAEESVLDSWCRKRKFFPIDWWSPRWFPKNFWSPNLIQKTLLKIYLYNVMKI